jgi:hypothetical protein
MTRRKSEIVRLTNERDFPHLVELAVPPEGFRSVFLEIDAFHRERRIPVRPESTRGQTILYSILFPRHRHCGCIPQSLRWRVLDPRTGEAQAADLGYVVGCTGHDTGGRGGLEQKEMTVGSVYEGANMDDPQELLTSLGTIARQSKPSSTSSPRISLGRRAPETKLTSTWQELGRTNINRVEWPPILR